jgi:mono/diheme cytochrome c family protein
MIRAFFLLTLACVLTGCKSVPPPTPIADLNPQQVRGHAVFQTQCAVCHYDGRSGGSQGPSLARVYKNPYLPSGAAASDERVTATILRGRGMMPAMGNTMDAQDLDDLVAYLHTL